MNIAPRWEYAADERLIFRTMTGALPPDEEHVCRVIDTCISVRLIATGEEIHTNGGAYVIDIAGHGRYVAFEHELRRFGCRTNLQ